MSEHAEATAALEASDATAPDVASDAPTPDEAMDLGSPGGDSVGPRAYDFQRPVGMAENTRRLLELAFEEVSGALESWLSAHLREPVDVTVDVLEEARFGLFRRELVRPCNAFLLGVEGGGETAVIQVDAQLAFTILERSFGSQAEQVHVPERALTWIERVVLRDVIDQVTDVFCRAWKEHVPIKLSVAGFETVPEMLPQSNQASTLQARLRIGGQGWMSGLTLVLPGGAVSTAVARRRDELPGLDPGQQAENRDRIQSTLQGACLPVSVRLPSFKVSLRQVSDLELGGLVKSSLPADTEVEIYVGDKLRFSGRVGRVGERLAVEVSESIAPGAERPEPSQER